MWYYIIVNKWSIIQHIIVLEPIAYREWYLTYAGLDGLCAGSYVYNFDFSSGLTNTQYVNDDCTGRSYSGIDRIPGCTQLNGSVRGLQFSRLLSFEYVEEGTNSPTEEPTQEP